MTTIVDNAQKLGQDNLETAMKTFGAFSTGFQTVASEIADYTKASFDRNAALFQDLAAAKNVGEAAEIQANYWRSAYEGFASEMTKLTGMWVGLAQQAAKPHDAGVRKVKIQ